MGDRGSVTGLYTVLVEGDDLNDPVADAARSVLDGHIVLSRRLAVMNHYPAVDVLESVSRVMPEVALPGADGSGGARARVAGRLARVGGPDPTRRLRGGHESAHRPGDRASSGNPAVPAAGLRRGDAAGADGLLDDRTGDGGARRGARGRGSMRKFRFALEGIERVRERDVRTHEVELAKTREALAEAERAREECRVGAEARPWRQAPAGTVVHVRHLLELDAERRRLTGELRREEKRRGRHQPGDGVGAGTAPRGPARGAGGGDAARAPLSGVPPGGAARGAEDDRRGGGPDRAGVEGGVTRRGQAGSSPLGSTPRAPFRGRGGPRRRGPVHDRPGPARDPAADQGAGRAGGGPGRLGGGPGQFGREAGWQGTDRRDGRRRAGGTHRRDGRFRGRRAACPAIPSRPWPCRSRRRNRSWSSARRSSSASGRGSTACQKKHGVIDDAELKRQAKLFAAMKAEEAASVLGAMDDATLALVLDAMNAKAAAKVMAKLDAGRVARLASAALHKGEMTSEVALAGQEAGAATR